MAEEDREKVPDTISSVPVPKDQTPECLALKAEIKAIEAPYEVPQSLADERRALAKELLEVKRAAVSVSEGRTTEDVEEWQQILQEIEDRKEMIERQIGEVDVKVEALEEQSRQAATPFLERAQKEGCLRG